MKFLVGESGSGKTHYITTKYPDILVINVDEQKDIQKALDASTIGNRVLINIFCSFKFEKYIDNYLSFPAFIEFHSDKIKIPKKYIAYVIKFKTNTEEVKKFCGKTFDNWFDAVIYKKYGIETKIPKKRSDLYYIKKLEFRYFKFKYSGLIQYV